MTRKKYFGKDAKHLSSGKLRYARGDVSKPDGLDLITVVSACKNLEDLDKINWMGSEDRPSDETVRKLQKAAGPILKSKKLLHQLERSRQLIVHVPNNVFVAWPLLSDPAVDLGDDLFSAFLAEELDKLSMKLSARKKSYDFFLQVHSASCDWIWVKCEEVGEKL